MKKMFVISKYSMYQKYLPHKYYFDMSVFFMILMANNVPFFMIL